MCPPIPSEAALARVTITAAFQRTKASIRRSRSSSPAYPGELDLERRIEAFVRWNAAVMVTRANAASEGIGGHMATPASATTLYEVGFNHFFHGKDGDRPGDQVFFQG